MRTEYLLSLDKDKFSTIENVLSFLFENEQFSIQKTDMAYELIVKEKEREVILSLKLTQTHKIYIKMIIVTETHDMLSFLEEYLSSKAVSKNILKCVNIYSDLSIFYASEAYPAIHKIEIKIRKFLILLVKRFGEESLSWFILQLPQQGDCGKKRSKLKKDGANIIQLIEYMQECIYVSNLESMLMEQNYRLNPDFFINDIDVLLKENSLPSQDFYEYVRNTIIIYRQKSFWDYHFQEICNSSELKEQLKEFNKYRNSIAHNKSINKQDYENIIFCCEFIEGKLNKAESIIDEMEIKDKDKELFSYIFISMLDIANIQNMQSMKKNNKLDSYSLLYIGKMYFFGINTEENQKEGLEFISASADKGNIEACYFMATLFDKNDEKDKAFEYYFKGAELGHVESQYLLGIIYEDDENYEKAIFWYEKASSNGNKLAEERYRILQENIEYI